MPRQSRDATAATSETASNTGTNSATSTAATTLAHLSRPGAALHVSADTAFIATPSRSPSASPTHRTIAMTVATDLIVNGWITPAPQRATTNTTAARAPTAAPAPPAHVVYDLSAAGRTRLRTLLMAATSPSLKSKSKQKTTASTSTRRRKLQLDTPAHRLPLLELLHARRDQSGQPLIDAVHLTAAQRLAELFHRAALQPRVTQSWDAAAFAARSGYSGKGGVGERDASMQAHARMTRALTAAGNDVAGLLIDVCCLDVSLTQVESNRSWPPGTARIVLRLALHRLAEHFGLLNTAPVDVGRHIRHWGDGHHRPTASRAN